MTEIHLSTIHPIVLAAGRSERMGRPKLLMEFDGKSTIAMVFEACLTSTLGTPIVVLGHYRAEIEAQLPSVGLIKVFNPDYNLGQTTSLKAGVRALPDTASAFIIFPADMPLIGAADLKAVAGGFVHRTDPARTIISAAYRDRAGHPVLVDIVLKQEFLDLDDLSPISDLIRRDRSRRGFVPVNHRGILLDMDTRRDYEAAQRELRGGDKSKTTRRKVLEEAAPAEGAAPPPAAP